jgi:hypothetical protein
MKINLLSSAILAALGFSGTAVFAAETASDTAANYVGSWSTSPANNGTGFGAWSSSFNNASPPYSGTYLDQTSYGNSDGVLSSGYAWGTYANSGATAYVDMTRAFNTDGSSASLVNQVFSVGLGSGGIGGSGSSMVASVGTAFALSYAGGGADNMLLSVDGGAANPIAVDFAQLGAGLDVALTVTGPVNSSAEGYSLVISPFAGGSPIYSTSGTFDASSFNTSSFTFADNNTSNDQFFNNLSITPVPEPSSLALLATSGLGAMMMFRRRK